MKKTLKIEGMSCMHCVGAVTKELKAVSGVKNLTVDLKKKSAFVETDGSVADETLRAAVEEAGYEVIEII